MFVSNKTDFECVLARGLLTDETAVLSVNFEVRYSVADDGSLSLAEPIPRRPTDPPDIRRIVLWRGTSVTASGTIYGPSQPPYEREVSLAVNGTDHRLKVFGPRRWVRDGKSLVPSQPEPFEAMPLSWEHAFGGEYELPPGADPDSGLPHPGGRVTYAYNPKGIGFYRDEQAAEGQPMPQIELADQLISSSADRPRPGGLSPCQGLPALRFEDPESGTTDDESSARDRLSKAWADRIGAKVLHTSARLQHHAPASLIFPWLGPETPIRVEGVGKGSILAAAPALPLHVAVRWGRQRNRLQCRLRSLHFDADRREALTTFGFSHRHTPATPPHWIAVRHREVPR